MVFLQELTSNAAWLVKVLDEEKVNRILIVPTLLRSILLLTSGAGASKLQNLK